MGYSRFHSLQKKVCHIVQVRGSWILPNLPGINLLRSSSILALTTLIAADAFEEVFSIDGGFVFPLPANDEVDIEGIRP